MNDDQTSVWKSYYPYEISDAVFDGRVYNVYFNLRGDILEIRDYGAVTDKEYGDGSIVLDPTNELLEYLQAKVDSTLDTWARESKDEGF